ncbi:MAG: tRNA-dihydrouridine synthase [Cellvibrionaceae bacterium]
MRIFLAPMEGVVDHTMRAMLSRIGGIDRCVTEFIRITDQCLPSRVFYRYCPELRGGGTTPSGVPVYVQLLGGRPEAMAANAQRAAELGAPGIDLNFGCPAKQVNRNDGGSIILREPSQVFAIARAVRRAVPDEIPVTVKIRLGYDDRSLFREVVNAIVEAGVTELTIHARTKADGYRPPAYWDEIAAAASASSVPIIANGEIWTVDHYHQCVQQSACADVMLGRGLLACPDLARRIKAIVAGRDCSALEWLEVVDLLTDFNQVTEAQYEARYVGNRVKQWLGYLRRHYRLADALFESVKRLRNPKDIAQAMEAHKRLHTNQRQCA